METNVFCVYMFLIQSLKILSILINFDKVQKYENVISFICCDLSPISKPVNQYY